MLRWLTLAAIFFASAITHGQTWRNVVTIPIAVQDDNYAHLRVNVNGGPPLDFIFDTGANICILTERGRSKIEGVRFGSSQETLGSGGVTTRPIAKNVSISIAGHEWVGQPLMLVDYGGGLKADGVIGYNLFADKTVSINYDEGVLEVGEGLPDAVAETASIKVSMVDGLPFLPATIRVGPNATTGQFEMDTGFTGSVSVAPQLASEARLYERLKRLGARKMGGTGVGVIDIEVVELPGLVLGGHELPNVPADIQKFKKADYKVWSMLGNDYLKRFNLVWDIKGKRVFVQPNHLVGDSYDLPPDRRATLILVGAIFTLLVIGGSLAIRAVRMTKRKAA